MVGFNKETMERLKKILMFILVLLLIYIAIFKFDQYHSIFTGILLLLILLSSNIFQKEKIR